MKKLFNATAFVLSLFIGNLFVSCSQETQPVEVSAETTLTTEFVKVINDYLNVEEPRSACRVDSSSTLFVDSLSLTGSNLDMKETLTIQAGFMDVFKDVINTAKVNGISDDTISNAMGNAVTLVLETKSEDELSSEASKKLSILGTFKEESCKALTISYSKSCAEAEAQAEVEGTTVTKPSALDFLKGEENTNGWKEVSEGSWKYYENGQFVTGWRNNIPGWNNWFYFDETTGIMTTGWRSDIPEWNDKWFYFNKNGTMATGWAYIDNGWYYFQSNGVSIRNATTPDGYVMDENGRWKDDPDYVEGTTDQTDKTDDGDTSQAIPVDPSVIGGLGGETLDPTDGDDTQNPVIVDVGGETTVTDPSLVPGSLNTDPVEVTTGDIDKGTDNTDTSDKTITNGWKEVSEGVWKYYENGQFVTGWRNNIPDYNNWFYFDESTGIMATGWKTDIPGWDGKWFYFNENGTMATGWFQIDDNWYYSQTNGVSIRNGNTPDGYTMDENGICINPMAAVEN